MEQIVLRTSYFELITLWYTASISLRPIGNEVIVAL